MEETSARRFTKICVFCGSNLGNTEEFVKPTENLGKVLAERNIHLVYEGGNRGSMGSIAKAAHNKGSRVLGIIPKPLAIENVVGKTVGDELQVSSMHERMAQMLRHADAFIALPGGFGTLKKNFQIAL